jgi:hypothetical protein
MREIVLNLTSGLLPPIKWELPTFFGSFAYRGSMGVRVYDSLNRKVLITVALTARVLAAFTMFLLLPHQGTRVPTTGATILRRGLSARLPILFGLEVRRQRFNLSEFDRVSLSRGFRAGYQVSLADREQELRVFPTANLGTACHRAEEVAA